MIILVHPSFSSYFPYLTVSINKPINLLTRNECFLPCINIPHGLHLLFTEGTKYDLDFKAPNKSVQNFKSGKDMIDMYKELCAGIYISCTTLSFYIFATVFNNGLIYY